MKLAIAVLSIGLSGLTVVARESPAQQPRPAPSRKPTYTIALDGRDACVTPSTRFGPEPMAASLTSRRPHRRRTPSRSR